MNVVSFETAKRLKEAGFPQPTGAYDGMHVYLNRRGYIYSSASSGDINGFLLVTSAVYNSEYDVFAPSATDILKELGVPFGLRNELGTWICFEMEGFGTGDGVMWDIVELSTHENPAEACAAAWLAIHEKTTDQ